MSGEELSYRELDALADRTARALTELGRSPRRQGRHLAEQVGAGRRGDAGSPSPRRRLRAGRSDEPAQSRRHDHARLPNRGRSSHPLIGRGPCWTATSRTCRLLAADSGPRRQWRGLTSTTSTGLRGRTPGPRTTWPTSSTPRVPRASPRASASAIATPSRSSTGPRARSVRSPRTASRTTPRFTSTCRCSTCMPPSSRAAACRSCPSTTRTSRARSWSSRFGEDITVWYAVPSALILMVDAGGLLEQPGLALRSGGVRRRAVPDQAASPAPRGPARRSPVQLVRTDRDERLHGLRGARDRARPERPRPDRARRVRRRVWAVKDDGSEAGIGEEGELLVSGPTVSLGYWGRKPQGDEPYRTGDIVRLRGRRGVLYVGRRDHDGQDPGSPRGARRGRGGAARASRDRGRRRGRSRIRDRRAPRRVSRRARRAAGAARAQAALRRAAAASYDHRPRDLPRGAATHEEREGRSAGASADGDEGAVPE